jgi:hypothetical protein
VSAAAINEAEAWFTDDEDDEDEGILVHGAVRSEYVHVEAMERVGMGAHTSKEGSITFDEILAVKSAVVEVLFTTTAAVVVAVVPVSIGA